MFPKLRDLWNVFCQARYPAGDVLAAHTQADVGVSYEGHGNHLANESLSGDGSGSGRPM